MSSEATRRRRLLTRALPIVLLGLAAFVAGLIRGADHADLGSAEEFAAAWESQNFSAMYSQISGSSAHQYSLKDFTDDYQRAETTATVQSVDTGEVSESDSGEAA